MHACVWSGKTEDKGELYDKDALGENKSKTNSNIGGCKEDTSNRLNL